MSVSRASDSWMRASNVLRQSRLGVGTFLAVAVALTVVAWVVIITTSSRTNEKPIGPIVLSADGLRTFALGTGQPVYWAGPRTGYRYELTTYYARGCPFGGRLF